MYPSPRLTDRGARTDHEVAQGPDLTDIVVQKSWKKLVNPTVSRGRTAWPKSQADQLRYGIRLDYDGEITVDNVDYHRFAVQPNGGAVPHHVQKWIEKNGGSTHAVITNVLIKKGGTEEDVEEEITKAFKEAE